MKCREVRWRTKRNTWRRVQVISAVSSSVFSLSSARNPKEERYQVVDQQKNVNTVSAFFFDIMNQFNL